MPMVVGEAPSALNDCCRTGVAGTRSFTPWRSCTVLIGLVLMVTCRNPWSQALPTGTRFTLVKPARMWLPRSPSMARNAVGRSAKTKGVTDTAALGISVANTPLAVDIISIAPERTWEIMSVSLPNWLLGKTSMASCPFDCLRMSAQAACSPSTVGCDWAREIPSFIEILLFCANAKPGMEVATAVPASALRAERRCMILSPGRPSGL